MTIMHPNLQVGDILSHRRIKRGHLEGIQGHREVMEGQTIVGYLQKLDEMNIVHEIVGVRLYHLLTQNRKGTLDDPKIMTVGEGQNQGQIEGQGLWSVIGGHKMIAKVSLAAEVEGQGPRIQKTDPMNRNAIKDIHDLHHTTGAEIEDRGHSI